MRGWLRRERVSEPCVYNSIGADAGFEGNFVGSCGVAVERCAGENETLRGVGVGGWGGRGQERDCRQILKPVILEVLI